MSPSSDHTVSTLPPSRSLFFRVITSLFYGFYFFHSHSPPPLPPRRRDLFCRLTERQSAKTVQHEKEKTEKCNMGKTLKLFMFVFFLHLEEMTISQLFPRISVSSDAWRIFFIFWKPKLDACIFPHCWDAFSLQHQWRTLQISALFYSLCSQTVFWGVKEKLETLNCNLQAFPVNCLKHKNQNLVRIADFISFLSKHNKPFCFEVKCLCHFKHHILWCLNTKRFFRYIYVKYCQYKNFFGSILVFVVAVPGVLDTQLLTNLLPGLFI